MRHSAHVHDCCVTHSAHVHDCCVTLHMCTAAGWRGERAAQHNGKRGAQQHICALSRALDEQAAARGHAQGQ